MKLVIDITESQYTTLNAKTQDDIVDVIDHGALIKAIKNGTPLPKGHGRLVDADAITKDLNTLQDSFVITTNRTGAFVGIGCTAPTIIEADTTRDCKTCGHSKDGKCAYTEECHDCMWESKYIEADGETEEDGNPDVVNEQMDWHEMG